MRILLGYYYYPFDFDVRQRVETWLARLRSHGYAVDGFCLTLNPPGPRLHWPELDMRWRTGDAELYALYTDLVTRLQDYDVFLNWNGINTHPEFVRQLPTFNVYTCNDDPESSEDLSHPVAWAYDLCMIGNVAAVDLYRAWGIEQVEFWPLGFFEEDYDHALTREAILTGDRPVDITLLCERESGWRRERLDQLVAAFPNGAYYGKGWPNGFLPEEERIPLYCRTKIGINLHNSTGPINYRTYMLPANGVMQICDNKSHLGQIFALDKEVVGFDTLEEAIEKCRYYLAHDAERREIAVAGWERALRDYNETQIFQRLVSAIAQRFTPTAQARTQEACMALNHWLRNRQARCRMKHSTVTLLRKVGSSGKRFIRRLLP